MSLQRSALGFLQYAKGLPSFMRAKALFMPFTTAALSIAAKTGLLADKTRTAPQSSALIGVW